MTDAARTVERFDANHRDMRLVRINLDRRQLDICRELPSARANRLDWVQADACCLPFADGSFDAVLCIEAMFHFRSRARFFREAARVLRPGGSCAGSDIVVSSSARPLERTGFAIAAVMQEGFGPWPDFWSDNADHVRLAESAGLWGEVRDVTANVSRGSKAASHEGVERQRAPLSRAAERLCAVQHPPGKDVEIANPGLEADDRPRKLLSQAT